MVFLFVLTSVSGFGQHLNRSIDSLISAQFTDSNGPGGVFVVYREGKAVYQKVIGKANLELDVDMNSDNVFQLGSMTKQFTAVSILMLSEQNKLNVSDSISKYISDYPNGNKITIHHLLTHTSGIKDYTKMKRLKEIATTEMSPKMLVDFFKDEPVDSLPGEKYQYNNSGYVLLGYIIEIVSGQSYQEFIETNIFKKLGMTNSFYAPDRSVIKNKAYGYSKDDDGYVNKSVISYSIPYSSGSLMSNVSDMLIWQNALNNYTILTKESTKKLFSNYSLNNGTPIEYGYGWKIKELSGTPTREHGGSIFGYKTMGVYVPKYNLYVLGFSNCDCNSPTLLTQNIAKLWIEYLNTEQR